MLATNLAAVATANACTTLLKPFSFWETDFDIPFDCTQCLLPLLLLCNFNSRPWSAGEIQSTRMLQLWEQWCLHKLQITTFVVHPSCPVDPPAKAALVSLQCFALPAWLAKRVLSG